MSTIILVKIACHISFLHASLTLLHRASLGFFARRSLCFLRISGDCSREALGDLLAAPLYQGYIKRRREHSR
ncbi:hypothetical protein PR003_g17835 [Phytophthora rubi]|uniref:Secreted protein n=1 Tax=Phytophthora rubi TaxID=129364 RepID=A0A6A4E8U1_9STRA|nr:hypothetical protein PR002_g19257 [Phytophthora rubi]KAE9320011.1 hypothetical protein PR003_g17835 [Phytophthora rubi]